MQLKRKTPKQLHSILIDFKRLYRVPDRHLEVSTPHTWEVREFLREGGHNLTSGTQKRKRALLEKDYVQTLQKKEQGSFDELKIVENIWRVECEGRREEEEMRYGLRDEWQSLMWVCNTFEPYSQDIEESQRNFKSVNRNVT